MYQAASRLLVLAVGTFLIACTASRLVTPAGETKLGTELARHIEQTIGLVQSPELTQYVETVGARVAAAPGVRQDLEYNFRVVNMEAPNAFALPGGYVYVSRGLLALLQTEDELANVLAHEVAHVSARHHLRHAVRQTPFVPVRIATGIGALVSGIISPTLGRTVAILGNAPGTLVLASYSRDQENEADALGQAYSAAEGWDPRAMSRVMEALAAHTAQRGGDPTHHSYFATHPTSSGRALRTSARAGTLPVVQMPTVAAGRPDFLRKLEGLLVGVSAHEGVIANNEYLHPALDLHVTFPKGWVVSQADHSVGAVASDRSAIVLLSIAGEGDEPEKVAMQVLDQAEFEVEQGPTTRTHDERIATYATVRRETDGKQYRYSLAWIAHGGHIYQISGGADLDGWEAHRVKLEAVAPSFRRLAPLDAPKLREGRLRIVGAGGASLEDVMPNEGAWSLEQASVANGTGTDAPSSRDGWFKIAPLEVYDAPENSARAR